MGDDTHVYIECAPMDTILSVKGKIKRCLGHDVAEQILSCSGMELTDDTKVGDAGLTGETPVRLVIRASPIPEPEPEPEPETGSRTPDAWVESVAAIRARLAAREGRQEDVSPRPSRARETGVRRLSPYPVFIKAFDDVNKRSLALDIWCTANTTISEVKNIIQSQHGYNRDRQQLIFAGKLMDDDKTVGYYDLAGEGACHLVYNHGH